MADALGLVYIAGFFFFLLLIYCAHIQLRRRKYKQIATELGAAYQTQGLFKTGKIAGSSNHRKYTVENQDGARGSGTWTIIEMQCANKGIPLYIYGRFFKNFPNWKYAFTLGDRTERVFVTNITLQVAMNRSYGSLAVRQQHYLPEDPTLAQYLVGAARPFERQSSRDQRLDLALFE